jgi:cell division protein YceG involved in septum cleavage
MIVNATMPTITKDNVGGLLFPQSFTVEGGNTTNTTITTIPSTMNHTTTAKTNQTSSATTTPAVY